MRERRYFSLCEQTHKETAGPDGTTRIGRPRNAAQRRGDGEQGNDRTVHALAGKAALSVELNRQE
jgi:hypothetical protein